MARVDLHGPIPAFFLSLVASSSPAYFAHSSNEQLQSHRAQTAVALREDS